MMFIGGRIGGDDGTLRAWRVNNSLRVQVARGLAFLPAFAGTDEAVPDVVATRDQAQIDKWWPRTPPASRAEACNAILVVEASGVVAVVVEPKGEAEWTRLCEGRERTCDTTNVNIAGVRWLLFKMPTPALKARELAPGVRLVTSGLLLWPPSTIGGAGPIAYPTWSNGPAALPSWLLALARAP